MNEVLNSMEKKEFEAKQFADFEDQFQWFIAISLILIFVNILIFERRTLWVKKLNVFNEKEN